MSKLSDQAIKVAKILKKTYPNPKSELNYNNEREFCIAVALSAQTTDKKVNQVTPALFQKFPSWEMLAKADVTDIETLIRQVNFYKGKASRLKKMAGEVIELFDGELPKSLDELIKLSGIARKSANVLLHELWDITEGIVVDTHVSRISNKLGLTSQKDPKKIEKDLMAILPKEYWHNYSGAAVLHGRYVCIARRPKCGECVLRDICPSVELHRS
jgi:endonuclease-3